TNLLDGPKHLVTVGAGLTIAAGARRVRIDAHGQLQAVEARTLVKQIAQPGAPYDPARALRDEVPDDPQHPETLGAQISNPGYPRITGTGFVWALGLTLTVER